MSQAVMTRPSVTKYPATIMPFTQRSIHDVARRKVAAYARASTDGLEQLHSYEAQVEFYTEYIKSRPNWDFVQVYADEGITGTNTKRRKEFNRMVADALAGKIELIVTKTIARFARNTMDTLGTIRKLKEAGVEVYFELQNIFTFDSKGEVLITILASLAQDESRNLSENITWSHRKRFADGKVSMTYGAFLGYEKGEDGLPAIVEEEADVVRLIYSKFLEGKTQGAIAKRFTALGIPVPGKGRTKTGAWHSSTVLSILTNERYKGDALLQKNRPPSARTCPPRATCSRGMGEGRRIWKNRHFASKMSVSGSEWDVVRGERKCLFSYLLKSIVKRFRFNNPWDCQQRHG